MSTYTQKFALLDDDTVDIVAWLEKIKQNNPELPTEHIEKAANLAKSTSKGLTTFYGQPCIEQGLEIAEILLDLKLTDDAIASAILLSAVNHGNLSLESISEITNPEISQLIQNVLQMNIINQLGSKSRTAIQTDRLRKTILAMVSDIRAVLIKLAERMVIMRGIKKINLSERKRIAEETMDIYAPLANRLGIGQIKWELEDISFHYINPESYKMIATFLAERRIDRENRIQRMVAQLENKFSELNINAKINGRAKHIYSIYLKTERKDLSYQNIYDYSAIRIMVPTLTDCYTALSIVHELWEHVPSEFDDYISHPKPNGYRSIHTAIIDSDGKHLEIQIRTFDMHNEAEHGIAAHWIYKENNKSASGYETKITYLRQLLDWHKDVSKDSTQPVSTAEEPIYVFTPAGDIIELPQNATPLDFAYHIHSEVGHHCRGAKINNHIVPLTHHLQTGDRVEILTIKNGTPSRDWLSKDTGYLNTARARAKVAQWFRHQDLVNKIEQPKSTEQHAPSESKKTIPEAHVVKDRPVHLQISGIEDLLTRIAKCCKPIPGDAIVGYITQGKGVSIHRANCNNIQALNRDHHNKMMEVSWDKHHPGTYFVDLQIRAFGRHDLLKEITALLAHLKIELLSYQSTTSNSDNLTFMLLTVKIDETEHLKQLTDQIKHLPNIIDVKRIIQ